MADLPLSIGRYQVTEALGRGGFATVYLAEDPRLDVKVAIKVLSDEKSTRAGVRARFIKEARIMRRLAAPGLVVVHDIDEHDGQPYFVMEYCERGTLKDRLEDLGRPVNLVEAQGLAKALTGATAGIHKAGVIHRDLKPGNYLIRCTPMHSRTAIGDLFGQDEELVVADFGLAKNLDPEASHLTLAGGTPGFSAPEQFRGDPSVSTQADVYALSAILVAAVSGKKPRPVRSAEDSAFTKKALDATGPLKPPLVRGLDFDPANRQCDAIEWQESLDQPDPADNGSTQPDSPTSTGQPQEFSVASRRRVVKFGAAALIGLMATGAVAVSPLRFPGPAIVGPKSGRTNDEATFAVADSRAVTWTVNDEQQTKAETISISPERAGQYSVTAATTLRSTTHIYSVAAPQTELRISGPGHAPVDESTQYGALGASGVGDPLWTIDGTTHAGNVIELTPDKTGVIAITLASGDATTTRSITVTQADL